MMQNNKQDYELTVAMAKRQNLTLTIQTVA